MKNRQLSLIAQSLVISVALNGVLLTIPALSEPAKYPGSTIGRIVDALGAPGGMVVERFFPGHDFAQVVIMLTSSVVFYAVVTWVALSAWTVFRASRSNP